MPWWQIVAILGVVSIAVGVTVGVLGATFGFATGWAGAGIGAAIGAVGALLINRRKRAIEAQEHE
jgi:TRAP-type mannitol/chloroaromatic compound transport system permease large subunit